MSVTPFCQPRRLVRFAGKHVHRPTNFFYRGFCCLERTSTRPTLTAHQSPTVPIQAENSVPTSLQHCMIPLRTVCWRVKLCKCKCKCKSYWVDLLPPIRILTTYRGWFCMKFHIQSWLWCLPLYCCICLLWWVVVWLACITDMWFWAGKVEAAGCHPDIYWTPTWNSCLHGTRSVQRS